MKRTEKIVISILTGLCLGFLIAAATSCVAKHPKCAAYDKCETPNDCTK